MFCNSRACSDSLDYPFNSSYSCLDLTDQFPCKSIYSICSDSLGFATTYLLDESVVCLLPESCIRVCLLVSTALS